MKFSFSKWCFWSFNQDLALPRPEEAQGLDSTHFMSTHCRGSPLCHDHLVAGGDFAAIEPWCRGAGSEWEHRVASTFICASNALNNETLLSSCALPFQLYICNSSDLQSFTKLCLICLYLGPRSTAFHKKAASLKKVWGANMSPPLYRTRDLAAFATSDEEDMIWWSPLWPASPHSELCLMRNRDNRAIDLGPARVTAL